MAATLDYQGVWIPPYYIESQYANASKASGRRPNINEKPIKGMTVAKMKEYADHLDRFVDEPTILIMDRLSSHKSKEVRLYFESKRTTDNRQKFKIMLLPPKAAFLISPLDFGFFGYWKGIYYKFDRSTPQLKRFAAAQSWKLVDLNKIPDFFRACHLVGNESEDTLRRELGKHVRRGIPEDLEEVWDFYDGWRAGSYTVDGVSCPREIPLEKPMQLLDSDLDGVYWVNWGPHGHKP
jgi:hypothetical protein